MSSSTNTAELTTTTMSPSIKEPEDNSNESVSDSRREEDTGATEEVSDGLNAKDNGNPEAEETQQQGKDQSFEQQQQQELEDSADDSKTTAHQPTPHHNDASEVSSSSPKEDAMTLQKESETVEEQEQSTSGNDAATKEEAHSTTHPNGSIEEESSSPTRNQSDRDATTHDSDTEAATTTLVIPNTHNGEPSPRKSPKSKSTANQKKSSRRKKKTSFGASARGSAVKDAQSRRISNNKSPLKSANSPKRRPSSSSREPVSNYYTAKEQSEKRKQDLLNRKKLRVRKEKIRKLIHSEGVASGSSVTVDGAVVSPKKARPSPSHSNQSTTSSNNSSNFLHVPPVDLINTNNSQSNGGDAPPTSSRPSTSPTGTRGAFTSVPRLSSSPLKRKNGRKNVTSAAAGKTGHKRKQRPTLQTNNWMSNAKRNSKRNRSSDVTSQLNPNSTQTPDSLPPHLFEKYTQRKERLKTRSKPRVGMPQTAAMADINHHYKLNTDATGSIFSVSVPIISYKGKRFRSRDLDFTKYVNWVRAAETAGDVDISEEDKQKALNSLKEWDDELTRRAENVKREYGSKETSSVDQKVPKTAKKYKHVHSRYMLDSSSAQKGRKSYDLSFNPGAQIPVKKSSSKKYSSVKSRYKLGRNKVDLDSLTKELFKPSINQSGRKARSKVFDHLTKDRKESSSQNDSSLSVAAKQVPQTARGSKKQAHPPHRKSHAVQSARGRVRAKIPTIEASNLKTPTKHFQEQEASSSVNAGRSPIPKKQPPKFMEGLPDTSNIPSPEGKTRRDASGNDDEQQRDGPKPAKLEMVPRMLQPTDTQPSHPSPLDSYRSTPPKVSTAVESEALSGPPVLNGPPKDVESFVEENGVDETNESSAQDEKNSPNGSSSDEAEAPTKPEENDNSSSQDSNVDASTEEEE